MNVGTRRIYLLVLLCTMGLLTGCFGEKTDNTESAISAVNTVHENKIIEEDKNFVNQHFKLDLVDHYADGVQGGNNEGELVLYEESLVEIIIGNKTREQIVLYWENEQKYEYTITNASGEVVFTYSDDKTFDTTSPVNQKFPRDSLFTLGFLEDLPTLYSSLPKGEYTLEFTIIAKNASKIDMETPISEAAKGLIVKKKLIVK